jgi:ribose transport system ATP-binding protein
MGMVSEDRKGEGLALEMDIADNLCMPAPGGFWVKPASITGRGAWAIERLNIKCRSPRQAVEDLSGGNQQKVALARLLDADCDILLLDEPTRGIDIGAKSEIFKLMDDLARGDAARGLRPKAILMVSSYLPDLTGACDRIAVMVKGRLGQARPARQWDEHTLLLEATGAAS